MEVFRTKTEETLAQETPEQVETPNVVEGKEDLARNRNADDDFEDIQDRLDVYEREKNSKYGVDYFKVGELLGEFNVKMHLGSIDKYVKEELEARKWEKTIKNWEKIVGEIEDEIGTREMIQFDRLQKIHNYIQVLRKYREIKKKKEAFLKFKEE